MRRRIAVLTGALLAVTALMGCAPEPEPEVEVTVSGEAGVAPELGYTKPLAVEAPRAEVVWAGDGPEAVEGEPVLLHYYAEAGADGSVIGETFSGSPKAFLLSRDAIGEDIFEALVGRTVGSRVLHLVPREAGQPSSTVAVFDILPTRAAGKPVEPREGLPSVELGENGAPTVTVPDGEPPTELVVQPLIKGTGPQVEAGQIITVQYMGITWSDGEVFDTSWAPDKLPTPFPIGVRMVIDAWDQALVEQSVGSQVLLVVPPELGYGGSDSDLAEETLVFVVDILAASGGPTS